MKKLTTVLFILFQLANYAQEVVYTKIEEKDITDEPPIYPGCEDVKISLRMDCLYEKIREHIKVNLNYPKEALKKNIQGKVYVIFLINKEGVVTDVTAKGGHPILQKEAIRIISSLPKMTPANQKGILVNVRETIPITFRLQ